HSAATDLPLLQRTLPNVYHESAAACFIKHYKVRLYAEFIPRIKTPTVTNFSLRKPGINIPCPQPFQAR
ncbi:MAG: hypothetical protein ACLFWL_18410, partial [Candidatus Brocadiia bacterium]